MEQSEARNLPKDKEDFSVPEQEDNLFVEKKEDNMGLFRKKYLDNEDKVELKARQRHINEQVLVVNALENAKQSWMASKYSKYGLDSSKKWSINSLTGKITEVKEPKKK